MDYIESGNLNSQSNAISFPNQSQVLGNTNFDEEDFFDTYDDEFQSASINLSVSEEYFISKDLDLTFVSIKKYSLTNTSSSSPPYSLCSTLYNASTCDGDYHCSSILLSHELNLEMTKDSKNIHDEEENSETIENPFHPLSYFVLYGGNSLNQWDHDIFLIKTSSNLQSK